MKWIGVLFRKKLIRSILNTPFMEMGKVWQEDFLLLSIFSFAIMVARTSWCGIICKLFLLSIMVVGLQCTLSHETFLSGVWVRPSSLTSGCWEFSERFVSSCIKFFQHCFNNVIILHSLISCFLRDMISFKSKVSFKIASKRFGVPTLGKLR